MQKLIGYGLSFLMVATLIVATGCGRGYTRVRRTHSGDRSVTIVHKPKYKGVSGRTTPVTTTKYNRKAK
ncbi:MAG TPA: hypothetical protein VHS96_05105 [Bacteroidia bacterium]|jgi:hypothetical protein|nr:hypothetical protein [Bacteroidia bacterium]